MAMKKADRYRERYGKTPARREGLPDRLNKVLQIFANHNFHRILDIGCGDGNFSLLLKEASRAEEVYGVDISSKAVELANAAGVKAFQTDIDEEPLPFEKDSFDAIFCGEVVEHLLDPDHLLDEIHRTLKLGGIAIITIPNLAAWYNRFVLLLGFQPFWTDVSYKHDLGKLIYKLGSGGGHLRSFTYRALKELLLLHQFRIAKVMGSVNYLLPVKIPRFLYILDRMMSVYPALSSNPIFVVQKREAG